MTKRKAYERMNATELAAATVEYDQPWIGPGLSGKPLTATQRAQYRRAGTRAKAIRPKIARDARGNVPARAAIDVSIARDLVTDRIRRGWTQTELARRSGIRLETISRIESGKHIPRQETLLKLDRALSAK